MHHCKSCFNTEPMDRIHIVTDRAHVGSGLKEFPLSLTCPVCGSANVKKLDRQEQDYKRQMRIESEMQDDLDA